MFYNHGNFNFTHQGEFTWNNVQNLMGSLNSTALVEMPSVRRTRQGLGQLDTTGTLTTSLQRIYLFAAALSAGGNLTSAWGRVRETAALLSIDLTADARLKKTLPLSSELASVLSLDLERLTRKSDATAELPSILTISGHIHNIIDFASELNLAHTLSLNPLQRINDYGADLNTTLSIETETQRYRALTSNLTGNISQTILTPTRLRMQYADLVSQLIIEAPLYIPSILLLTADLTSQLDATQIKFDRIRDIQTELNSTIGLEASARIIAIINLLASLDSTSDITIDPFKRIRTLDAELGGYLYIIGNMTVIDVPGVPTLLYDRTGTQRIYLYDRTGQTMISPEDLI